MTARSDLEVRLTRWSETSLPRRFWRRVLKSADGCWMWTGHLDSHGYGQLSYRDHLGKKRNVGVHRLSYEMHIETPSPDLSVCHTCDNPACVNPLHLYQGTHKQNMLDRAVRERGWSNKLTASDVVEVRRRIATGETQRSIARAYGVHFATISLINKRANWKHVT